jgi:formiminoglutamase
VLKRLDAFMTQVDCLYVTIDLDVFTAATAPGVSAPAMRGIDLPLFEAMFEHIQQSGKVRLMDIAECNPSYDLDNRTARLAAYLVFKFLFNQA